MTDGDILQARFEPDGERWQLTLEASGAAPKKSTRSAVPDPDDLFRWIVSPDENPELLGRCWRLRVRPHVLDSEEGALPPVVCWPRLLDHDRQSVFLRDWSLLVMTASPQQDAWEASGALAVLCDPALAASLTARHLDGVTALDGLDALTEGAVLVVPGAPDVATVNAIRAAATERRCPLVVWCGTVIPAPERGLLEVVPTGEALAPHDSLDAWLTRMLAALQGGTDPELALARSLRDGPPGSLDAWLLRGCVRPWRVREAPQRWHLRFLHWRYKIDRTLQDGLRAQALEGFLASETRRVQVVVLAGPTASGMDYFRARRLPAVQARVDPCAPAWPPSPAHALDALHTWYDARPTPGHVALRTKLQARRGRDRRLLVHVNHEVAEEDELPLDALGAYLDALANLGASLPPELRVLVSVYVTSDTPRRLDAVKQRRFPATLGLTVLPPLEATIPEHEVEQFLADYDLPVDAALVKELAAMRYAEIVETLTTRYPTKLRAP